MSLPYFHFRSNADQGRILKLSLDNSAWAKFSYGFPDKPGSTTVKVNDYKKGDWFRIVQHVKSMPGFNLSGKVASFEVIKVVFLKDPLKQEVYIWSIYEDLLYVESEYVELKNGDKGIYVVTLQNWAKMLGLENDSDGRIAFPIDVTGILEGNTARAIYVFQMLTMGRGAIANLEEVGEPQVSVDKETWSRLETELRKQLPPNPESITRVPLPERENFSSDESYGHAMVNCLRSIGIRIPKAKTETQIASAISGTDGRATLEGFPIGQYSLRIIDNDQRAKYLADNDAVYGDVEFRVYDEDGKLDKTSREIAISTAEIYPADLERAIRLLKALIHDVGYITNEARNPLYSNALTGSIDVGAHPMYARALKSLRTSWGQFYGAPWMGIMIDPSSRDNPIASCEEINWGRRETISLIHAWGQAYLESSPENISERLAAPILLRHLSDRFGEHLNPRIVTSPTDFVQTGSAFSMFLHRQDTDQFRENAIGSWYKHFSAGKDLSEDANNKLLALLTAAQSYRLSGLRLTARCPDVQVVNAVEGKLEGSNQASLVWDSFDANSNTVIISWNKAQEAKEQFIGKRGGIFMVTADGGHDYFSDDPRYGALPSGTWSTGDWIRVHSVVDQFFVSKKQNVGTELESIVSLKMELVKAFRIESCVDMKVNPWVVDQTRVRYFWLVHEDVPGALEACPLVTRALKYDQLPNTFADPVRHHRVYEKWRKNLGIWENADEAVRVLFVPRLLSSSDGVREVLSGFISKGDYEGAMYFADDECFFVSAEDEQLRKQSLKWTFADKITKLKLTITDGGKVRELVLKRTDEKINYKRLSSVPVIGHKALGFDDDLGNKELAFQYAWFFGVSGIEFDLTVLAHRVGTFKPVCKLSPDGQVPHMLAYHPPWPDATIEFSSKQVKPYITVEELFSKLESYNTPFYYLDTKIGWLTDINDFYNVEDDKYYTFDQNGTKACIDLIHQLSRSVINRSTRQIISISISDPVNETVMHFDSIWGNNPVVHGAVKLNRISFTLDVDGEGEHTTIFKYLERPEPQIAPYLAGLNLMKIIGGSKSLDLLFEDFERAEEAKLGKLKQKLVFWTANDEVVWEGAYKAAFDSFRFGRKESSASTGIMTDYPHRLAFWLGTYESSG